MSDSQFHTGSPLLFGSPAYLERDADRIAAVKLRQMQYITLIEPRQSGKTSLINHLSGQFSKEGYAFAVRDLTADKSRASSMQEWFQSLGERLLEQLSFTLPDQTIRLPDNIKAWEDYLDGIANCAMHAKHRVIIVLDEIGAMPKEPWTTDFFAVIRSICTTRQTIPARQYLSFIIAGVFNPKDLIQDRSISEFNIAQQIHLDDFDNETVRTLVSYMKLNVDTGNKLAERIYYWTDGQPYLSQQLCVYLNEEQYLKQLHVNQSNLNSNATAIIDNLVDEAVWRLFREDSLHLKRIEEVATHSDLLAYTRQITRTQTRFRPGLNDKQFYLAHENGIVKTNSDGYCKIRNRIYESALDELETGLSVNANLAVSRESSDQINTEKIQEYCRTALIQEFALAWSYEKRAKFYGNVLQLVEYSTWATFVILGSIALSFGVDFPAFKYILWIIAAIALFIPVIDLWARIANWKDLHKSSLEASQRHRKLADRYESFVNAHLLSLRKLKSEVQSLDKEKELATGLDSNETIITDREKRRGQRAALLHFQYNCPSCHQKPTSMKASNCSGCGNF